jgi:molybdopterin molybdotransferase
MRPGKPVFAGMLGSTRVLGLPGNPVSAFICSVVFLLPLLRRLLGMNAAVVPQPAILSSALPENGPRQNYQRASSTFADDGTRHVRVLSSQDSSLMAALAHADCLIVQPRRAPALPAGAKILVLPLAG